MDFDTKEQPRSVQNLFYEIRDITTLLSDISKRSLTGIQKELMFSNKLAELLNSANNFINDREMNSEIRSQAIFHAIPILNDLITLLSEIGEMDFFWLEVLSLLNEFIIIITSIRLEGNVWNYQETSALLTKTLTQLPIFKSIPVFPPTGNIEFINIWKAMAKSICTTAVVYVHGIEIIDSVSIEDLTKWATLAFNNFILFLEFYDKTDIITMLKDKQNMSNDIVDISNLILTIDPVQKLTLLLQSRFGDKWPESLSPNSLISKNSIDGILPLYDKLQKTIKRTIDNVMPVIIEGKLAIHENPGQLPYAVKLINQIKIYDYSKAYLTVLKALVPTGKDMQDRKLIKNFINEFLNQSNWYLKHLETISGGKESILISPNAKTYISVMKNRLEVLYLVARWEKSIQTFEEELNSINWLINKEEVNIFPDFYFFYYITKLTTYTYLSIEFDMDEIFQSILKVREHLVNRPRDFIACSVLLALLSFVTDKSQKIVFKYLEDARQKGIIGGNQYHLSNKFNKYVQDLQTLFSSKNSESLFGFPISDVNELDSMTWMIPSIQKLKSNLPRNLFLYVPFNRAVDSIKNNLQ